jgi:hypothetical protein
VNAEPEICILFYDGEILIEAESGFEVVEVVQNVLSHADASRSSSGSIQ